MGGFMESFFDVKIWLAVKPSTSFAQKHTFNIDIHVNPQDLLIVY
jgi:hypothetical protein